MPQEFFPKQKDEKITSYYPSGNIQEEKYFREDSPANGWSRKTFFENGNVQLQECFSNSLVIEQIAYDEAGNITGHKIYSHRIKQLIDKPVQTEVVRHNTVSGTAHMGFYFQHLPAISKFIGAEYNEDELDKAYKDFINSPSPYRDMEIADEEREVEIISWSIRGTDMGFGIGFEHGEGYYQWNLWTKTAEDYEKARYFMESLV